MNEKSLSFYLNAFEKLRRDEKSHLGKAPHKPILLLSLIDQFESQHLSGNRVFITPELIASFKSNWSKLVETGHTMDFGTPFSAMGSEIFWKLVPNEGCELWVKSRSALRRIGNLQTAVSFAEIDESLARLLEKKESRSSLRQLLLEKYFQGKSSGFNGTNDGLKIIETIETEIESSNANDYQAHLKSLKNSITKEDFEIEVAIRGGLFKRKIPEIYGFTCCISGFGISTNFSLVNLIEACHIRPISQSFDDTLSNGIALCPTLHKAFDAGIFTISDDFKILVSGKIREENSPQNIGQFDGLRIRLPIAENHWPSPKNLQWHRNNKFEKGR